MNPKFGKISLKTIFGSGRPSKRNNSTKCPEAAKETNYSEIMNSYRDFVLEKTLGTGSFGRVHLAKNVHDNKYYALKVLTKAQIVEMNQVEHTINEKKIVTQLSYPLLVHCYSTFQDPENLYFVFEYVSGGELFTYLMQSKKFNLETSIFYSSEVVLAFEYMHSLGILYRDLKPENILISPTGHIKLTDFGFAKYVKEVTWTLCGTPDYLAPEIIQSKAYGPAVDWWSLGVLIYEMLTGYPPFYNEDPLKLYERILACNVRFPPDLQVEASDLISKLLCKDITKRYGNLRGGVNDIKNHPFYASLDWGKAERLETKPPFIPTISKENDTSRFCHYAEREMPYDPNKPDIYVKYFMEF